MEKYILVSITALLLVVSLAACGGSAPSADVVEPAANAPVISPEAYVANYSEADHILLDVRTPGEVSGGVISGAINIPLNELSSRAGELPTDKTVVVYCNSGSRSRQAVNILNDAGYTELLDLGGVVQWQRAGYNLVPSGQ